MRRPKTAAPRPNLISGDITEKRRCANGVALLWTILVTGAPTSGKSYLARRLLKTLKDSVRINPDELRLMYFDDPAPVHDEDLVYHTLTNLRKFALNAGHSVIIDSTAPRHVTREFFLSDRNRSRHLVVVMDVDRKILQQRAKASDKLSPLMAFESVWQEPHNSLPVFKFRNDNKGQFETSFYLLMEYINHEYTEHSSILRTILRLRRGDDGPVKRPKQGQPQPDRIAPT
jgi:predicted kinase